MALIIPNRGGYQWTVEFVGQPGEITSDSDNHDLILHDGATPGGHRFLNYNNAIQKFQPKLEELDGFSQFTPDEKGLLIRTGVASYRVGALAGTPGEISVTYGDGQDGNPTFSLPATITKDLTFSGIATFAQSIVAQDGIIGDTQGNHDGDTAGTHYGPVVGDVTGDADGNHTGSFFGDVDVRGKALLVDDDSLTIAKINGLAELLTGLIFPPGAIIEWAGSVATIPAGWALCNGLNGTPDLRGKFIVGAGGTYAVGASGGALEHTHNATIDSAGSHSHGITVEGHALTVEEIPSHWHANGVTDVTPTNLFPNGGVAASATTPNSIDNAGADGTYEGKSRNTGGGNAHSHGATSESAGSHAHGITLEEASVLPPYYALCKIMKL